MIGIALALLAVNPAAASPAPAADVASPAMATAAPDAAHLTAARKLVALIIPKGALATMFGSLSRNVSENVVRSTIGAAPNAAAARARDPNFDERLKRTTAVTFAETGALLGGFEPVYLEAVATAYARRFSLDEMRAQAAFFASPAGQSYARQSLTLTQDPAVAEAMRGFVIKMSAQMPDIVAKAKAATADLPPVPAAAPGGG